MFHLLTAGNTGRYDDRVGILFDGRKEPTAADCYGNIVVFLLIAKRSGHSAAARVDFLDRICESQRLFEVSWTDQRLLMAVPVKQCLLWLPLQFQLPVSGLLFFHDELFQKERRFCDSVDLRALDQIRVLVPEPFARAIRVFGHAAQKREHSAQDVGLTVSAFDEKEYRHLTRGTVDGLAAQLSNVQDYATNTFLQSVHIRGIGLNEFQGQYDSPVAQHYDGVDAFGVEVGDRGLVGLLGHLVQRRAVRGEQVADPRPQPFAHIAHARGLDQLEHVLVLVVTLGIGHLGQDAHQGGTATGHHAFLDGGAGGLFLTPIGSDDGGHAASQQGQSIGRLPV